MPRAAKEVSREQILEALRVSSSCVQAAQKLMVSVLRLWQLCDQNKIIMPNYKEAKIVQLRNCKTNHNNPPIIKDDGRDVRCSVDPEERDYYYNLDFLCGTYHGHHNKKGQREEPYHKLGYGEDECLEQ